MRITYIGGPTAIIEWEGVRLLTDPTFDPPGEYQLPSYTLRKTQGPALRPEAVGRIDAVLLSHDHHFDNLDRALWHTWHPGTPGTPAPWHPGTLARLRREAAPARSRQSPRESLADGGGHLWHLGTLHVA